jgi:competence protein ComEC
VTPRKRSKKTTFNKLPFIKYLLAFVIILVVGLFLYNTNAPEQNKTQPFTITFLDVGQGDSTLIQCDNKALLIDAGPNSNSAALINTLKATRNTQFDFVVATHPHEDHIGGMDSIIRNFDIEQIMMPKISTTTQTFIDLLQICRDKNVTVVEPVPGRTFKIGSALCTILAPNNTTYDEINDYSIVLRIEYGDVSAILTGDAEAVSEKEILAKNYSLKSTIMKVAHHGSSSSTTDEFLSAVSPEYAVISVGRNNDYGHPHQETISRLVSKGIKIYQTDLDGEITFSSNGTNLEIRTGK